MTLAAWEMAWEEWRKTQRGMADDAGGMGDGLGRMGDNAGWIGDA